MIMQWRRRIMLSLLGVAIVAVLVYGFWPQPVTVELGRVSRGPLQVSVEEEGRTRVRERFMISAPVAAYARRLDLDVGDRVSAGQALVDLEPLRSSVLDPRSRAEAQARVAAAAAALKAAQEKLSAAASTAGHTEREYQRLKRLRAVQYVSENELEQAMNQAQEAAAAHRAAKSEVEVARYQLEAARTVLKYSAAVPANVPHEHVILHSPVAGRVLKVYRRSEGVVASGEPLLDIGNPQDLEVEVDVLSEDAVRLHRDTPVVFDRWGGPRLQGVVRVVEPVGFTKVSALGVEEQRVRVIVDFTSPQAQWARLGDGYRIDARFILWQGEDVLQVPASALFRYRDAWAVFAVRGGRAVRTRVEIGHRNGLAAQVLKGLNAGETVITHPSDAVDDGVRVAAARD